jgi:Arc/MetJ-type ribon-helix-helix transcriptional regulator
MSEQIAVRIPDELAESLEDLVASGRFETKAEAIRSALETLVDGERRRRIGELIVQGYLRIPQGEAVLGAATLQVLHELEAEEDEAGLSW